MATPYGDELQRLREEDEARRRELVGDLPVPTAMPEAERMAGNLGSLADAVESSVLEAPYLDTSTPVREPGGAVAPVPGEAPEPGWTPIGAGAEVSTPPRVRTETAARTARGAPNEDTDESALVAPLVGDDGAVAGGEPEPVDPTAGYQPTDHTAEIGAAQARARREAGARGLNTAGAMFVRAMTGQDDVGMFQKAEAAPQQDVAALFTRIREKKAAEADRLALAKYAYEQALGRKRDAAKTAAEKAKLDADAAANAGRMGLDRARLAETERHNRAMEARPPAFGHGLSPMYDPAVRTSTDARAGDARLNQLGTATTKFSDVVTGLKTLDEMVPGITDGNVPQDYLDAYGNIRNRALLAANVAGTGTRLADPKAVEFDKAIRNFSDLLIRARTGAVINDQEMEMYQKLLSTKVLDDPKALPAVVKQFKALIANKLRDAQAAYAVGRNPVLDMYEGSKYTDPFFAGALDQPAEAAPPTAAPAAAPTPPTAARPTRPAAAGWKWVRYAQDPSNKWYQVPEDKVGVGPAVAEVSD